MSAHQPRPAASFAARSKRWTSSSARSEPKSSQNAQRNYERYLALARAEAQIGNAIGAENYYQYAEHYSDRCPRIQKERKSLCCDGHLRSARTVHDKGELEWQCHGEEKVLHAEKVASERVFGRDYDVWDVHTDRERWWVVTDPTNLYSQTLMPSLDYTLSFHIGLMARVGSARSPEGSEAQQEFLRVTTRKIAQAGEAFDKADEAEEFQAVGMRCREALLSLVKELNEGNGLVTDDNLPKASDFPAWNERIANATAPGGSAEHVRGYLKTTAEPAWRPAHWLTHAANATRDDARFTLAAASHVVDNYAFAILKKKSDAPERCGRCKSYKITVDWRPDLGTTGLYVSRCEACGAEKLPTVQRRRRAPKHKRSATRARSG
jgi:hypothetical protein